ncbi:thiamine pyrophosphate-binding protein [Afifella pfennigii]|uniref:thiamine pyrophosphate-binding protein n=1 Tax=Afifella pfennigii TaxID=209897 RepID=UPI00047ACB46|nr:thiamine pyrophosphate-binding protein [Afifella pfennigii]
MDPHAENQSAEPADDILAALRRCGVSLAASLPDDWVTPLLRRLDREPGIRHVPVAREAEAVAVASGAFFTGARPLAIMGATGLFTCLGELATLNLRHQIPLLILASERGSRDDHRIYQEVQGRRLKEVLASLDFPHFRIATAADVAELPDAYTWCRIQKRPVVGFLTRKLLKGATT